MSRKRPGPLLESAHPSPSLVGIDLQTNAYVQETRLWSRTDTHSARTGVLHNVNAPPSGHWLCLTSGRSAFLSLGLSFPVFFTQLEPAKGWLMGRMPEPTHRTIRGRGTGIVLPNFLFKDGGVEARIEEVQVALQTPTGRGRRQMCNQRKVLSVGASGPGAERQPERHEQVCPHRFGLWELGWKQP